jgi:hypothetical protein
MGSRYKYVSCCSLKGDCEADRTRSILCPLVSIHVTLYHWVTSHSVVFEGNIFCIVVIICFREPLCSYGNKTGSSVLAVSVQSESGCQDSCTHQDNTERIQHVNRWRFLAWFGEENSIKCSLWMYVRGCCIVLCPLATWNLEMSCWNWAWTVDDILKWQFYKFYQYILHHQICTYCTFLVFTHYQNNSEGRTCRDFIYSKVHLYILQIRN